MTIPASYLPASWNNTAPVDRERRMIGLGLRLDDGSIARFTLDLPSAISLIETMTTEIDVFLGHGKRPAYVVTAAELREAERRYAERMAFHSDNSSGNPQRAVSPQDAA